MYAKKSPELEQKITYGLFFRNMRAMTAIISSMFAMIFMLFFEPVLAEELIKRGFATHNSAGKIIC